MGGSRRPPLRHHLQELVQPDEDEGDCATHLRGQTPQAPLAGPQPRAAVRPAEEEELFCDIPRLSICARCLVVVTLGRVGFEPPPPASYKCSRVMIMLGRLGHALAESTASRYADRGL